MDQELVARARQGDQRAFVTLAETADPRLFRLAFGVLRDREQFAGIELATLAAGPLELYVITPEDVAASQTAR